MTVARSAGRLPAGRVRLGEEGARHLGITLGRLCSSGERTTGREVA
ncbi:hypothetical protein [Kitasatospora purpeofusca]